MAVKKGYKQTEVGMIPEEWDCAQIGQLATTSSGTTPSRSSYDRYFKNGSINWVKTLDLNNGVVEKTDERVTTKALEETSLSVFPTGTVLVAMYGGFMQIGRTGILAIPACVNQALTAIRCNNANLNPSYLLWVLNHRVEYWKSVASSSRKDPNITSKEIREFPIPLPPTLAEQEAIAGALSDAAAWIESLEQLIAKKRQIKQGAMQELLTGKRRLPGFSGEWTKATLGELGRWAGGMTPSMANTRYWEGGDFPWVSSGDVKSAKLSDTSQHITMTAIRESATTVMPAGAIIIVNRSGILRRYLPVSLLMRDMAINQDIKGVILKPGLTSEFVLYCILHAGPDILASCLKAGTTVESIELTWLKRFAILLPNLDEQTAIATVLSDMDTEIESLESKLAKAREIKQGMMQELLTGRIRLVG